MPEESPVDAYDAWFRAKVHEALADAGQTTPHQQAMAMARAKLLSDSDHERPARS